MGFVLPSFGVEAKEFRHEPAFNGVNVVVVVNVVVTWANFLAAQQSWHDHYGFHVQFSVGCERRRQTWDKDS